MTFRVIMRGSPSPVVAAEYMCPDHGRFEMDVQRTAEGDAPDEMECPWPADEGDADYGPCPHRATWCISAPMTRVQKVTAAVKGKWQKPEHKTWTDTSNLAEGQPLYEWKEDRAKIWEEKRKRDVVAFAREHNERVRADD